MAHHSIRLFWLGRQRWDQHLCCISALFGIPQHKGSLGISIEENPQRVNSHGFDIHDIVVVPGHIFSIHVSIDLDVYRILFSSRPNELGQAKRWSRYYELDWSDTEKSTMRIGSWSM